MDHAQFLTDALGPPQFGAPFAAADSEPITQHAPAGLRELWRTHGLACYGNGLFWTIDPSAVAGFLPAWLLMPPASLVFARDAFANLYLLSEERVFQFDVHFAERELIAMDFDMFFLAALNNPQFHETRFLEPLFDAAVQAHGPLQAGQCYGCFPAVALGGMLEVSSLQRVQFLEYLNLLSQLQQ